jgi:hypothetical protein
LIVSHRLLEVDAALGQGAQLVSGFRRFGGAFVQGLAEQVLRQAGFSDGQGFLGLFYPVRRHLLAEVVQGFGGLGQDGFLFLVGFFQVGIFFFDDIEFP